ncbi:hypothetical protein ABLB84_14580 [Xenorhabdus szentirmaii]|uniref:hypothetical protein n=1 Tax=Xenorhabdus szentirmaii TaxID=290112 RepID=UPI0032B75393
MDDEILKKLGVLSTKIMPVRDMDWHRYTERNTTTDIFSFNCDSKNIIFSSKMLDIHIKCDPLFVRYRQFFLAKDDVIEVLYAQDKWRPEGERIFAIQNYSDKQDYVTATSSYVSDKEPRVSYYVVMAFMFFIAFLIFSRKTLSNFI